MKTHDLKLPLLMSVSLILSACTGGAGGGGARGKNKITLWAWGDEAETEVFTNIAREYNETNTDNIYVNFVKKPSNSYYSSLESNLTGRQAPDLFYVGDSMVKRYAKAGYLEDISQYVDRSSEIELDDMWPLLMERFKFNPQTYQSSEDSPLWGLPKDNGPTAIFYNEDAMTAQGIKVISVKDDDGDGLVTADGHEYPAVGYNKTDKVFNNKIAMTFEELNDISALLNHSSSVPTMHQTKWTYYSTWWFFAGWSVGGDCIQFHQTDDSQYNGGYYEFALNDQHPNYRVLKDVVLNSHQYKANSFVDFYDLPFMASYAQTDSLIADGTLVRLPSIYDMFTYWISLFENGISPKPEDGNTISLFTNQEVAMYVTGRYETVNFRKYCNFAWDCAPLPRHKDGIGAGHSGSMCMSMSKKCKDKESAFKVMEFFCGKNGQDKLAETGFNVPTQMSLAKDPTKNFLNSDKRPYNNEVFLDAAVYQKGGDWTYLADDIWIEMWAPTLNGDVLNGDKTVQQLFDQYIGPVNEYLKGYTKKN